MTTTLVKLSMAQALNQALRSSMMTTLIGWTSVENTVRSGCLPGRLIGTTALPSLQKLVFRR